MDKNKIHQIINQKPAFWCKVGDKQVKGTRRHEEPEPQRRARLGRPRAGGPDTGLQDNRRQEMEPP